MKIQARNLLSALLFFFAAVYFWLNAEELSPIFYFSAGIFIVIGIMFLFLGIKKTDK